MIKIISNERYNKLKKMELWEEILIMKKIPLPKKDCVEEEISYLLETKIPYFLGVRAYKKNEKISKGEIGKIFGKSIIIK